MLQFQRGDVEAFDQLVRRNTPKVYALAYRFVGDYALVQDAAQEAFLRVYRTAARYQPTAKFSTWLYRIVVNVSLNMIRSRKRVPLQLSAGSRGQDESQPGADVPDCRSPGPADALHTAELASRVASAIGELPENQRIAIILRKYEEKTYDEIAEVLGLSIQAVKSLLSRARARLKERLGEYLQQD